MSILVAFVILLGAWPAAAQVAEETSTAVQGFERELGVISQAFDGARQDDGALADLSSRVHAVEEGLIAAGVKLSPRLTEISARLDQIGTSADDQAEPSVLQEQRSALLEERSLLYELIGRMEELSVTANTLANQITEARRELFTTTLSRRYDITKAFTGELLADLRDRYSDLADKVTSWANFVWQYKRGQMLTATALSLAAAVMVLVFARRLLGRLIRRDPEAVEPGYFSRLLIGFLGTLLPTLGVWVFLSLVFATYSYFSVLRGDIGAILASLFVGTAVIVLVSQLAEAVLAPRLSQWRLVAVTDHAAGILKFLVVVMAITTVFNEVITQILHVVGESLPITVATSLVSSTLTGLLLLAISAVRPFAGGEGEADQPWPGVIRLLLRATGIVLILAVSAGFIGFAEFGSRQIVVTGAVASTIYLGYLAAHALSRESALVDSRFGAWLRRTFEMSDTRIDQLGLVAGILLTIALAVIGVPVLLLLWGFQWADIRGWILSAVNEFSIGSLSISITGIIAGVLIFIVGYWLTKVLQRWLDRDVLTRSRMDTGVRNSVKTAFGYVGVTIAALIGVAAAGIDLSQLALVAGALSLGIGFGLQNIVSNFVSGLILLAERPFKVGDWIEAGGVSGTVKSINVRATEIETFQHKSVILPNSELINSAVGNWTHRNTLGRVEIPVGVAYESDPNQVRDILLDIAREHPLVLSNPEPYIAFLNFGDSSLDFDLRVYLADIGNVLTVGTDIRFAILERFREARIEIPFPQRDLHLRVVREDDKKDVAVALDLGSMGPDAQTGRNE
ncbi:mechanosensitive ion channel domain-containing protein [Oricola sp.]|uniref:mechanosensitive ion channel family protein n=1 Tax=Oricola sp. TaxID=1979950 RepID=UPI0025CCB0F7|nr:mechanosensitive ion channel domain-containing protein [Oricola sp.]MCI5076198.1 mechanosensitive ion channel [Oricola sp.]